MSIGYYLLIPINFLYAYDPQHLDDLKSQISNKRSINCTGYHLENADLSSLKLKKANFSRAYLTGVSFANSNLSKENFKLSDLTNANLTKAIVSGAQFRGARLSGILCEQISAKGTFFADTSVFSEKMSYENKIQKITTDFLRGDETSVKLNNVLTIKKAYPLLHRHLSEGYQEEIDHLIFDFRENQLEKDEFKIFFQECLYFLRAPFFKEYAKKALPICDNHAVICFLSEKRSSPKRSSDLKLLLLKPLYLELPILAPGKRLDSSENLESTDVFPRITSTPSGHFLTIDTLDLHGKFPIHLKFQWISKFIQSSYEKNKPYVYIITGRGLHNPDGKMGIFWKLCKRYLKRKKFDSHIKQIISISKNGGWKVILKKKDKISQKFSYCDWKESPGYPLKAHQKFSYNKGVIPFRNDYKTIIINKKPAIKKSSYQKKGQKKNTRRTKSST